MGLTTLLPLAGTGLPSSKTWPVVVAFHWRVLLAPGKILTGVPVKKLIVGQAFTVTVKDCVAV